tara:strand:- start:309 stop:497 length:189 start_codon:yes stop_codon:yes gene_type:complete
MDTDKYKHNNETLEIYRACIETYPCRHQVIVSGKKTMMNGVDIFNWFKSHNVEVPDHFKEYQ